MVNSVTSLGAETMQHTEITKLYAMSIKQEAVYWGVSTHPLGDVLRRQQYLPYFLEMTCERELPPMTGDELRQMVNTAKAALDCYHLRNGWYQPVTVVLDFIERGVLPDDAAAWRRKGRKLTQEDVLRIFREVHRTSQGFDVVGSRWGIGPLAVGRIARGQSWKGLFRRTPLADWEHIRTEAHARDAKPLPPGSYYISEDRPGAPQYLVKAGQRHGK